MITAFIIAAQLTSSHPPLTPQQAADVLRACEGCRQDVTKFKPKPDEAAYIVVDTTRPFGTWNETMRTWRETIYLRGGRYDRRDLRSEINRPTGRR